MWLSLTTAAGRVLAAWAGSVPGSVTLYLVGSPVWIRMIAACVVYFIVYRSLPSEVEAARRVAHLDARERSRS